MNVNLQLASQSRNVTLFGQSRDATRYEVRGGHPADVGFDVTRVETRIGRPVARVTISDVDAPGRGNGQANGAGKVGYFRPNVQRSDVVRAPAPGIIDRRNAVADADLQRMRAAQQTRLDSELNAQHARLLSDQDKELRAQTPGPRADAVRKQQVVEQQAFTAHAAQPNRSMFIEHLQRAIARSKRHHHYQFSVLFLDVDQLRTSTTASASRGRRIADRDRAPSGEVHS